MAAPPRAHDAPGPPRRREELRRLRGEAAVPHGSRDGRADPRRALRHGARRVELHVRRGDAHAAAPRLDREPHAGLRLLRRRAGRRRVRSAQERRHGAVSLRARRPAPLRRARHALRDDDPAGAPGAAARQGQGRGRRAGGRAVDRRPPAPRDLLHAGGAQRADRRALGRPEREADAPLRRREPGRALRAPRSAGAAPAARPSPSSTPSGSTRGSTSTTTSPSSTTPTPCRTRSCTKRVEVRLTATALEVFHAGQRVAAHRRSAQRGGFTTDPAHMPKAHQAHHEWRPSRFIAWAGTIGPQTAALVAAILADRPHPEQGYRSCLGILRLAKRYDAGAPRSRLCPRARRRRPLVSACRRDPAARPRSHDRHHRPRPRRSTHENIRGRDYYH